MIHDWHQRIKVVRKEMAALKKRMTPIESHLYVSDFYINTLPQAYPVGFLWTPRKGACAIIYQYNRWVADVCTGKQYAWSIFMHDHPDEMYHHVFSQTGFDTEESCNLAADEELGEYIGFADRIIYLCGPNHGKAAGIVGKVVPGAKYSESKIYPHGDNPHLAKQETCLYELDGRFLKFKSKTTDDIHWPPVKDKNTDAPHD